MNSFPQFFSGIYTSPFLDTDETKNGCFTGPKSFRDFRETGPRTARSGDEYTNDMDTASPTGVKQYLRQD